MAAEVLPWIRSQFLDSDGNPLSGGKIYTYKAGTTTPLATYSNSTFSANTNPIILDSTGSANIFLGIQSYKFVIKNSSDVTIDTIDNVVAPSASLVGVQSVFPFETDGVGTEFDLETVEPELVQNVIAVLKPDSGDARTFLTSEYSVNGTVVTFDSAPATGDLEIRVGSTRAIGSLSLSDGSVTTVKLANLAVTNAKLSDNSVSTAKIQDDAITGAKIGAGEITGSIEHNGFVGEVRMFHTFNGTVSFPRGWMICNGDVVDSTNYDAIHGAGTYLADGISSSDLDGVNLPDLVDKYPVGASSTSQDGSGAITSVGNSSHQVNISHSHTVDSHNHKVYDFVSTGDTANVFNSSGSSNTLSSASYNFGTHIKTETSSGGIVGEDLYTDNDAPGTSSSGSATQSIQPESIQLLFIIKVI